MRENSAVILTIEDERIIRENIVTYLQDCDYEVFQAENGRVGVEVFREKRPDLVLLDLRMPEMNGIEAMKIIHEESPDTPVIIISGTGTIKHAVEALKTGAWDYITKPIREMAVLDHAIEKALERSRLLRENKRYNENLEEEIRLRTAELMDRNREIQQINEKLGKEIRERIMAEDALIKAYHSLEKSANSIIYTLSYMSELRDPYTGGHQQRVAVLSRKIGMKLGLGEDRVQGLFYAALLHDIGKIAVPIEILLRTGKLSVIDYDYMKQHPSVGFDILKETEFKWPVAQMVLQHHERIDGSGYPSGVTGEYILLEAKIIAVADVVESMATHRPYRQALGVDVALEEIIKNRNILYDERVVDLCLSVFHDDGFSFDDIVIGRDKN